MNPPTSNDQARGREHAKSLREQEGHREDKNDVRREVEQQQGATSSGEKREPEKSDTPE
jgi:hypothetical protein